MKHGLNGEMSVSQVSHLIDEWVFSERDRKLLKRRMIDHIGFEKLAEEFDMSVCGIKKAVYKAQEQVFKHI